MHAHMVSAGGEHWKTKVLFEHVQKLRVGGNINSFTQIKVTKISKF